MGKRFGRTQKNRMRARIAELEAQQYMSQELNYELEKILNKKRRMLDEIDERIRRYCEHSAILPPRRKVMDMIRRDGFDLARMPPLDIFAISAGEMASPIADDVMMHSVRMHVVDIMCEDNAFNDTLHMRVRFGRENEWRYSLTKEALRRGLVDDQYIAENVTRELLHAIRNPNNERR